MSSTEYQQNDRSGTPTRKMPDSFLLKMIEQMTSALGASAGMEPCGQLIGSYNALVQTAKTNHPDDPFLRHLGSIDTEGYINAPQLLALLGQLRLVLKSWES